MHALPGYSSYLWQDGSADSVFVTDHPGKFWVTVQDEFGCSGTDSIMVSPFQIPDLGVEQHEIICRGDSLILSPGANYQSYLWQDGSENPEFLVTEEGDYWVQMETNCGFYSDSVKVVFYKGILDLGQDTTLCDGEFLSLNPGNGYSKHLWSNGSTENNIMVKESGIYWLKAYDGFCYLSDSIEVDVCASLWFPNVFTPNSDGINDVFYAVATNPEGITAFKMTIFNRWGRIVHEMGHVNEVWDGKINGSSGSAGSYFWVCDFAARDKTGNLKNHSRQGSVTLFR
jgi:gliding motility-associated-like protein